MKQNTYKTPHLNRSGVTYNYLKSGNSGARLTMKLGIMEEKLTQTAPWTDELRARIGKNCFLVPLWIGEEHAKKKKKKEKKDTKREQVHTQQRQREKKKREAQIERVTSSRGGIRSIGLYMRFHQSFFALSLSLSLWIFAW